VPWPIEGYLGWLVEEDRPSLSGGDDNGDGARVGLNLENDDQGLTLVHFSAQREHFLWDRGLFRGGLGGVLRGAEQIRGYLGCILCQKRFRLS